MCHGRRWVFAADAVAFRLKMMPLQRRYPESHLGDVLMENLPRDLPVENAVIDVEDLF